MIPSLEILTVDNFVINLLRPGFASLTHLKEIYFRHAEFTPFSTCNVTSLSNKTFQSLGIAPVSKIFINWCKIGQFLPFTFYMFKNLTYLELSKVAIAQVSEDEGIEIGLQQSTVHHLRFSLYDPNVCFISFPILKALISSQLQVLEIHSTPAYKVEWTFFKNLPVSLNHLHLKNNHIIDVCLCGLFRLKNLNFLDLSHQNNKLICNKALFLNIKQTENMIQFRYITIPKYM